MRLSFEYLQDLNEEQIVIAIIDALQCVSCGESSGNSDGASLQDMTEEQVVIKIIQKLNCGGSCA